MVRRFDISISCASCVKQIKQVFSKYPDIKYEINVMDKMLIVEADEIKYPNDLIIQLVKKSGYEASEI